VSYVPAGQSIVRPRLIDEMVSSLFLNHGPARQDGYAGSVRQLASLHSEVVKKLAKAVFTPRT
jgi:hypothetical protein